MAAGAVVLTTACSSDEQTMPENPPQPEVGNEVPTLVVYEANPRFFATENCLNALTSNLQRISNMGCDIVWLMPVSEPSSAPQSIGSPYSIKNYDVINPKYGTLDDLKNLVSTAHNLGMKVILDWVPNHTGWDNPWITEHPNWFLHNDKGEIVSPPGQGWADVAQLNYDQPGVAEGMAKAIEYWVTAADVDGFRFDYADSPYIPASFWTMLASELRSMKNDIFLLAESTNRSFYDYGYNMIYDWNSAPTISDAFKGGKPTSVVEEGAQAWSQVPEGDSILRYVFNHDTMAEQPVDSYFGSIDALPAAYVCASMLNGTPLIYSAMDAEGLTGKQSFFNYTKLTFSEKFTPVYKAINDAFKASAEVRRGVLRNFSNNNVVSFTRAIPGHNLFVAVNVTGSTQSIASPITLRGTSMTDMINGGTVNVPVTIELGAYQYCIYMN